jgi:hypothetical protein
LGLLLLNQQITRLRTVAVGYRNRIRSLASEERRDLFTRNRNIMELLLGRPHLVRLLYGVSA